MTRLPTHTLALALALLVAGVAAALPPTFPRTALDPFPGSDHTDGPHFYLDAHLDRAAFLGSWDCILPFGGTQAASVAMVCAEAGWWHDVNADGIIDAPEWQTTCDPTSFDVVLTPLTPGAHWGSLGVVDGSGTIVLSGPVTLTLDACDPATGYYRSTTRLTFPGDPGGYAIGLDADMCGATVIWGAPVVECLEDTDVY